MSRKPHTRKPKALPQSEVVDNVGATKVDHPVFGQPHPTPDPAKFAVKHPSDNPAYKEIDKLNAAHKLAPLPFPAPRGVPEPRLTLAAVLGVSDATLQKQINANGQIVFHAAGDTGSTRGPKDQNLVADKMVSDFTDDDKGKPLFFFHLGDVIYSFGEGQYYYDQFYEPYRDYPAPIVALAGNHDGMVAPGTKATTLAAFLENFCVPNLKWRRKPAGFRAPLKFSPVCSSRSKRRRSASWRFIAIPWKIPASSPTEISETPNSNS